MKRVRIELYRSAQYSWMASSVSEEAVSALSLAYKTAACVKTMPNLRAFLARALRAAAPRLPYMMRNSRTSAQTKDFSVKTMELTRVRKALMNPERAQVEAGEPRLQAAGDASDPREPHQARYAHDADDPQIRQALHTARGLTLSKG